MFDENELQFCKIRVIFINEFDGDNREIVFDLPFFPATSELGLNSALDGTCQRIPQIHGSQVFQVDFSNRMHRYLGVYPFQTEVRVPYSTVINGLIQIIYKPFNERHSMTKKDIKHQQDFKKQKKVKERSIQEVVQAVKLWRKLYDTDDGTGKRLYTLAEAAKVVGTPKKTLDDYYSLIRAGIAYSFNFEMFKKQKIGLLRKFVKIGKQQGQAGINLLMEEFVTEFDIEQYFKDY